MISSFVGRASPFLVFLSLGCKPTVNEEHCLFHLGDLACGEGHQCLVVVGGGTVPTAVDGCVSEELAPALEPPIYLHLKHGLPLDVRALSEDIVETDSIQGALARELVSRDLEAVCPLDPLPQQIQTLEEAATVVAARRRLEEERKKRRPDADKVQVTPSEAHATDAVNAAIEDWLIRCDELLNGGPTSSSTGADGGLSDATMDESAGTTVAGDDTGTTGPGSETTARDPSGYRSCPGGPQDCELPGEDCLVDDLDAFTFCSYQGCRDTTDCPVAPNDARFPPVCDDVSGDGIADCYLTCGVDSDCPPAMGCFSSICVWPT